MVPGEHPELAGHLVVLEPLQPHRAEELAMVQPCGPARPERLTDT